MKTQAIHASINEYGYGRTVKAVQALYNADKLNEEQARVSIEVINNAYIAQFGKLPAYKLH